jgi:menaquinone-specific isochorismate synthase
MGSGILSAMTMTQPETQEFLKLTAEGIRKAQSLGSEILVSHTQDWDDVDPLDIFSAAESFATDRWLWESPDQERAIVSIGTLAGLTPPRNVRFSEVGRAVAQYASRATVRSESAETIPAPLLFAAFSYDPHVQQDRLVWQGFPSTYLLTPRMTICRSHGKVTVTLNATVTARTEVDAVENATNEILGQLADALDSQHESQLIVDEIDPDKANESELMKFVRAISRAESTISNGEFSWITIARRKKLTTNGIYRVNRAIKYLRERFPSSSIVATGRHSSTFIGYAPDSYVTRSGNALTLSASTGEGRRGETPALDEALAQQLLNDPNELEFHDLAMDHIDEVLDTFAEEYEIPDEPVIRSSNERHYLHTRVDAEISDDTDLFSLLQALHAAPETSGSPVADAFKFVREEEQLDRGWFGSPFGWVDLDGNAEFILPRQCAVVRAPVLQQQRAYLFTSTPVFSGADPEDHLSKSERDLEPLISALKQ